jgi:hypothetical protein
MKYELTEKLMQDILNYLSTRPLVEVLNLWNAIQIEIQNNKINQDGEINGN